MAGCLNTLAASPVLVLGQPSAATALAAQQLLGRYGLVLHTLPVDAPLPGSFWGEAEAGIVCTNVYVRPDTPLHSLLHESCHTICMDSSRRAQLHTDAGGDTDEENAVCYLQILLADYIPNFGRQRALTDMDSWGYTFRLGSAQRWFEEDAADAQDWLIRHGLLTKVGDVIFAVRQ